MNIEECDNNIKEYPRNKNNSKIYKNNLSQAFTAYGAYVCLVCQIMSNDSVTYLKGAFIVIIAIY